MYVFAMYFNNGVQPCFNMAYEICFMIPAKPEQYNECNDCVSTKVSRVVCVSAHVSRKITKNCSEKISKCDKIKNYN
jgi:hypothetical protein